jgi:hypothetical protein
MINSDIRTDSLFPKRSFWSGLSSVFSVFGNPNKFNTSKSGSEADYKALKSDWEMIGKDIQNTMNSDFKLTRFE